MNEKGKNKEISFKEGSIYKFYIAGKLFCTRLLFHVSVLLSNYFPRINSQKSYKTCQALSDVYSNWNKRIPYFTN